MNAYEKPARTFWGRVKWALRHPWGYQRAILREESRKKREFDAMRDEFARSTGRDYTKELEDFKKKHRDDDSQNQFMTPFNQGC